MTTVESELRVYADTSVFGGCFDNEFKTESVRFFEEVRLGRFIVVISNVTLDELELAPDQVRGVAKVVGPASSNDAAHIALATMSKVDLVVSWNFKHIVHFEKIGGYEGVNRLHGYGSPRIYSPREVVTL
jgi:predicted nucleic acid-binding protein